METTKYSKSRTKVLNREKWGKGSYIHDGDISVGRKLEQSL